MGAEEIWLGELGWSLWTDSLGLGGEPILFASPALSGEDTDRTLPEPGGLRLVPFSFSDNFPFYIHTNPQGRHDFKYPHLTDENIDDGQKSLRSCPKLGGSLGLEPGRPDSKASVPPPLSPTTASTLVRGYCPITSSRPSTHGHSSFPLPFWELAESPGLD